MSARDRSTSPGGSQTRARSRSPQRSAEMEELQSMINLREQSRKDKDWANADVIRDQLRAKGVQLFDKLRTWSKDGVRFTFGDGMSSTPSPAASADVTIGRPSTEPSVPGAPLDEVSGLIDERERARQSKDFTRADQVRDQLKAMGVEIRDKEKVWKTSEGKLGLIPDWGPPGLSGERVLQPQGNINDSTIAYLIDEREMARGSHQWDRADQIRDLLKSKGVQIYDKQMVWVSRSGTQGPIISASSKQAGAAYGYPPQQQQQSAMNSMYGGMGGMTPEMMAAYQAWGMPAGGMGMGGPGGAAAGTGGSSMGMGMGMGGMGMGGMGGMGGGGMGGGMGGGAGGAGGDVETLVSQREVARLSKDYAGADKLRDALRAMGVHIDDKSKTWKSPDGRTGQIPSFSSLQAGGYR